MSRESIGLEIATVTIKPEQRGLVPEILMRLDEQTLSPELRKRWAANGLRGGLLGVNLPESINFLLMEAADRRKHPTAEAQQYLDKQVFVQCRESSGSDIDLWGNRNMTLRFDDGAVTEGAGLQEAQCMMQVFGSPQGIAGAEVRIVPAVEHGPLRQKYVVQDNAFHIEAKPEQVTYEELALAVSLRPGEVLMVTGNGDQVESLGASFFHHGGQQKILLIRLAQTPIAELFESEFESQ